MIQTMNIKRNPIIIMIVIIIIIIVIMALAGLLSDLVGIRKAKKGSALKQQKLTPERKQKEEEEEGLN